jgi:hypothetical protein
MQNQHIIECSFYWPFNIFINIQYHPIKVFGDVTTLQLSNVNIKKIML